VNAPYFHLGPGANTKALRNISPVKQTHAGKSFGAAKLMKESIEQPKIIMDASLLLTPTLLKWNFKRHQ